MAAVAGQAPPPNCPGGGGSSINQMNNSFSAETHASAGLDGVKAGASMKGESNAKSGQTCPTVNDSSIIQKNNTKNLTSIDNSVMIMNKNNLTSMSESVNQMIVNSITNTSSSSSQNVNVAQSINIKVSGVKGNVIISDIAQTATIDLSNSINMELSAVNNVRTDLATQVLQQFESSTNADQMSQASSEISKSIENQTAQSVKEKNNLEQSQVASSEHLPASQPVELTPPDPKSNIKQRQEVENNLESSVFHSSPFSLTNDVSRTISNSIKNSVTQNFTHNTVTQLMQAINISQSMNIDVSSVGGDVVIKNLSQMANIQLRQVLSGKMDIGTAIVSTIKDSTGIKTDDEIAIKKTDITKVVDTLGLRNDNSFSSDVTTDVKNSQSITTGGMGGLGELLGALACCCILCCCCSICICVAPMLGGMIPAPASEGTTEVSSEQSTSDDKPPTPISTEEQPLVSSPESPTP